MRLEDIDPVKVSLSTITTLDEVIRKCEILISIQMDNFRAIDNRAMRLITSTGLLLSLVFGLLTVSGEQNNILDNFISVALIKIAIFTGVISTFLSLLIIQSEQVHPPGNDGLELLNDISDNYCEHETRVDYIIGLSMCRSGNEKIITKNGNLFRWSSWLFFAMLIFLVLAGFSLLKPYSH